MQRYIAIIRPLKGPQKIKEFCDAVETLDLTDEDLDFFAWHCGFLLSENIRERNEHD